MGVVILRKKTRRAENDDREPVVIKNFLENESWTLRSTPYRGYKVYNYSNRDRYGINYYNRDQLLVIWHGQCITVPLEFIKVKIRLPEYAEPVETSLKLPDFECLAVVIDYGAAPVTPKLPDRNALILDAKTVGEVLLDMGMAEADLDPERLLARLGLEDPHA